MCNQRNHVRLCFGLALTLIGLISGIIISLDSVTTAAPLRRSTAVSTASGQENPTSLNRWSSNGPDGANVLSLAIDPSHPAIVYAGTQSGVFKSSDAGESWSTSLTNASAQIVAIAPSTPTTIYAAGNNGVYKSVDGGKSWEATNHGLENQYGPINVL